MSKLQQKEIERLGNVATSVQLLSDEIASLPRFASPGDTIPVNAHGSFVHHSVKSSAYVTMLTPSPNHWTAKQGGWRAEVVVHLCTDEIEPSRLASWLSRDRRCLVEVLHFQWGFAHLRLKVPTFCAPRPTAGSASS